MTWQEDTCISFRFQWKKSFLHYTPSKQSWCWVVCPSVCPNVLKYNLTDELRWWNFTHLQYTIWWFAWRSIIPIWTISREIISSAGWVVLSFVIWLNVLVLDVISVWFILDTQHYLSDICILYALHSLIKTRTFDHSDKTNKVIIGSRVIQICWGQRLLWDCIVFGLATLNETREQ